MPRTSTYVGILKSPNVSQLDEMVELIYKAYDGQDIMIDAMTGGVPEFKRDMFRLSLRAAALEGAIFICQELQSKRIVSVSVSFGPGTSWLGSEAQRALGADQYFNELSPETRDWWDNYNRPLSKKLIDSTIGDKKKTDSWWPVLMATLPTEQRKGYATLVTKTMCKKAQEDKTIVALNATNGANITFYGSLGFEVVGGAKMPSPFGTMTNTIMVWGPKCL